MSSPEFDLAGELFPEMLTTDQVAELMNVDSLDVEQWADEGILKSYKIACTRRYDVEDVKSFIRRRQDLYGHHL